MIGLVVLGWWGFGFRVIGFLIILCFSKPMFDSVLSKYPGYLARKLQFGVMHTQLTIVLPEHQST